MKLSAALAALSLPALVSAAKICVNQDSTDVLKLSALKGVGKTTARRIGDYVTINGGFSFVDDMAKVSGIGKKKVDGFKNDVELFSFDLNSATTTKSFLMNMNSPCCSSTSPHEKWCNLVSLPARIPFPFSTSGVARCQLCRLLSTITSFSHTPQLDFFALRMRPMRTRSLPGNLSQKLKMLSSSSPA